MKLLQNILTPVDFGLASLQAVNQSIKLAEVFGSSITLIHVLSSKNITTKLLPVFKDQAKEKLDEIAFKIKSMGLNVRKIVLTQGIPVEKIALEAQSFQYNVIVTGTGNKPKTDRFQLGTTVEKLLRKSQVPVWVAKHDGSSIKNVVCPVDFSQASARALTNAIFIAEKLKATLHIINVYEPLKYYSERFNVDTSEENKLLVANQESELNRFLKGFSYRTVAYKKYLISGSASVEILDFIKKKKVDLLVMGTTGKTTLNRLLMGSVTEKTTREIPCSFITTKALDITNEYVENNLTNLESLLNAAKALFDEGKFEEAKEKYESTLEFYPDNIPAFKGLINTYKGLGETDNAEKAYQQAREIIVRTWGASFVEQLLSNN